MYSLGKGDSPLRTRRFEQRYLDKKTTLKLSPRLKSKIRECTSHSSSRSLSDTCRRNKLMDMIRRNYPLPRRNKPSAHNETEIIISTEKRAFSIFNKIKKKYKNVYESQISRDENRMKELKSRIENLQRTMRKLTEEKQSQISEIDRTTREMTLLDENVNLLRNEVDHCVRAYDTFCFRARHGGVPIRTLVPALYEGVCP